jgi:hypothetical protein
MHLNCSIAIVLSTLQNDNSWMLNSPGGNDAAKEPKGAPSTRSRSTIGLIVAIFSALQSLCGCGKPAVVKPAPQPTVADLKFPVVLIQDGMAVLPRSSADELLQLHSNYLNINGEVGKTLIDSDFNIYTVLHLRSTQSGLSQMMHPVGITPVTFELAARGDGLEAARSAIAACTYLGGNEDQVARKRTAVNAETTLAGMIKVLQSE